MRLLDPSSIETLMGGFVRSILRATMPSLEADGGNEVAENMIIIIPIRFRPVTVNVIDDEVMREASVRSSN